MFIAVKDGVILGTTYHETTEPGIVFIPCPDDLDPETIDVTGTTYAVNTAKKTAKDAVILETKRQDIRRVRDRLLAESDFTQVTDAPFTAAQKTAWKAYRQALRDLPDTMAPDGSVTWPTKP